MTNPINPFTDNEYLYHYTTIEIARKHILNNTQIRLGQLEKANDPVDSKGWFLVPPSTASHYNYEYCQKVSDEMKRCIRISCFTTDRNPSTNILDINNAGFTNPQMWHYYGDKNSGVCLVFNKQKLIDHFESSFDTFHHGFVHYLNKPLGITNLDDTYMIMHKMYENMSTLEYTKYHLSYKDFYRKLMFQKSTYWKDEREYRFLTFSDSHENDTLLNFTNRGCLDGIVFGSNTSLEDYYSLRTTYMNSGISGLKMEKLLFKNGTINLVPASKSNF